MKHINAAVAAAVALIASLASADSFELFDGSIATNEFINVKSSAGDHLTIVNSTLEVTNNFQTIDKHAAGVVRNSMLYVGITNSTITSLEGILQFNAVRNSTNTTRVDVVSSVLNATNSFPGALKLGVWDPNAATGERVLFNATNSTFNLSHLVSQGACDAEFTKCTLVFDENLPTGDGFGIGGDTNMLAPRVTFRDCLVTNWTIRFGDRRGAAPTVITFDGGEAHLRKVKFNSGYCKYSGDIVVTNGAKVLLTRPLSEQTTSESNMDYYFCAAGTTNRLWVVDGGTFGLNLASTATRRNIYAGYNAGSLAEWNIVGGTFDNAASAAIDIIYFGYNGEATLNIGEGGTFKCYQMHVGSAANTGATRRNQRIIQTGGLFWSCKSSANNKHGSISLCDTNGHDCRYILDGGILKTPQIYGNKGASVKGGTGYAVLSANGGTITPGHSESTAYDLVNNLDRAECGPKGLTVDTADYPAGAKILQEFTNKEGEQGLFRKTGANTLNVGLPGYTAWDVATTLVDGGTLVFTNATANLDTTLVVADGGTLSMVGSSANLTLDALAVTNGVIALDPGDKITVPGNALFLGDFTITFSEALAADAEADVFQCEGEVSSANVRHIRDALAAAAVPEGSFCTAVVEVSEGVTHIRLKVAEKGSRLSETTTWNGAADAWATAGNWSDGVPTASTWAEFPLSAAQKSLTVPASSVAGSLRFTADGYTLSGGTLRIPGMRGAPVVANEVGTNTISAALAFDDIVEITNAPNTRLVLSGGIAGGSFEKTGAGALVLDAANTLGGNVTLSGGKTVVGDPAAFGADEGITTAVALNADALEFSESVGDDAVVEGRFTATAESDTKAVAMIARTNVTMAAATVSRGAFVKAGPGKLTMLVSGGEHFSPTRVQDANTYYFSKYFVIDEDGQIPDNGELSDKTTAYYGGVTIYEGELAFKAADGTVQPEITSEGSPTVIGVHTDGATVTPTMTLDGVHFNNANKDFFANGFNIGVHIGYGYVESIVRNRLTLVNDAKLTCRNFYSTFYGAATDDMKPVVSVTNSTVIANTAYYIANNNDRAAGNIGSEKATTFLLARGSTFTSPLFYLDGRTDADFDACTAGPAGLSGYSAFTAGTSANGTIRFRNGSVFRADKFDLVTKFQQNKPTRVVTLVFDDSEWQYGITNYVFASSIVDPDHATNFVVRMEGRGVVLKPVAGTTFTTQLPFQGDGGMVVDGPGTVAFSSGTVQFSGVAEVKQGTLDLSAEGALSNFKVKGPGTISGGTLSDPTIMLDVADGWVVSAIPTFSGCTLSGTGMIDCGRTAENPLKATRTPVTVARFTGAVPDVSGWRLVNTGASNLAGNFSVSGDEIVMTVSRVSGIMMIIK